MPSEAVPYTVATFLLSFLRASSARNPGLGDCSEHSRRTGEPNVVSNDRRRSNGKRFRIGDVELLELDFVFPHLPQEIFENLDRELLGGAATISETKWRKAGIVADGQRLATDDAIDGAKDAIVQHGFPAVIDTETRSIKGAFDEADLFTLGFVDLVARQHVIVAIRVELFWVLPVDRVETGVWVQGDDVAISLVW